MPALEVQLMMALVGLHTQALVVLVILDLAGLSTTVPVARLTLDPVAPAIMGQVDQPMMGPEDLHIVDLEVPATRGQEVLAIRDQGALANLVLQFANEQFFSTTHNNQIN